MSDTFTTGLDGMGRPVSLTGSESPTALTWVQNVVYDQASRMTTLDYRVSPTSSSFTTEAMSYNVNGQLGSMGWSGSGSPVTGSLTYSYSATQNNGQITQVVDSISGETVVYQYDSLKRLTSAASTPNVGTAPTAWTETYGYDGFGSLTSKVLNGATTTIAVDATTNRLSSASYDSNGNMTSGLGAAFTFDVANRALSAAEVSGGSESYGYAPDNQRIYKKLTSGAEEYTFYGARGEKLGVYSLTTSTISALRTNVWFAGKLISENGSAVFQDRIGTNRAVGARFRPYGDEITSTTNDRQKFGTYTRDGYTGLDYADQRFYASSYGRFNTPDRYQASAGPKDPGSWNRYSYAQGDPINYNDPSGRMRCRAVGSYTTRPNPEDALTEVTFVEIQCKSSAGVDRFLGWQLLEGTRQQTEQAWESYLINFDFTDSVAVAEAIAEKRLADCSGSLFPDLATSGPGSPLAILQSLESPTRIVQYIDVNPDIRATTANYAFGDPGPDGFPTFIPIIAINTGGAFVKGNYDDVFGFARGGSSDGADIQNLYRAITLIHELGHALAFLGYNSPILLDGPSNPGQSFANSKLVAQKCFGYQP